MLIDIGVNLAHKQFNADRSIVVARAFRNNVEKMICTGVDVDSSVMALRLHQEMPQILYATAGVHPHHADRYDSAVHEKIRSIAVDSGVVAVGECGLDYNRLASSKRAQRLAFSRQIEIAIEVGKPLFLHERDAHQDFRSILQEHINGTLVKGVVHCFTGTPEEAECYLEMGFDIGLTGWITDARRNQSVIAAISVIPLGRIHLESDAPYLSPRILGVPVESRNEPKNVTFIAGELARIKSCEVIEVEVQCEANSRAMFNFGEAK